MPDAQGRHSRAEMEEILRRGEGIVYRGQVITKTSELPTDADMARGDPAREAEVAANLRAEIQRLQSELEGVRGSGEQEFRAPVVPESQEESPSVPRPESQRKPAAETDTVDIPAPARTATQPENEPHPPVRKGSK